jgi:heat shock protein HtpX
MIVAIVFAILAPIAAQLMYFALSRKREYLADASAVRFTRYPEGLASALEKISQSTEDLQGANKVTAPMYIVNPLKKKGRKLSDLTSTHPPISERIRILRSIASGASMASYQEAYRKIHSKGGAIIPPSGLTDKEKVPIRKPGSDTLSPSTKKGQKREMGDIMRAVNKFAFIVCAGCGLKMKIPPDFKKKEFDCPRCGTTNQVPLAQMAAAGAILEGVQEGQKRAQEKQQVYHRKGTGWETFRCICGNQIHVSPYFTGSELTCSNCGRDIRIKG